MSNLNYPFPPAQQPLQAIVQPESKRGGYRWLLWLLGGSFLLLLVLCLAGGVWVSGEVKREKRRRELIGAPGALLTERQSDVIDCDLLPWPGLEKIPRGRRIGSWMIGQSPLSLMRAVRFHRECDSKIADEFLTLFPETTTVIVECGELDPKLADRIARVGRQQYFTMVIRQRPGDNVDALLKVCADHRVPLDELTSGFTGVTAEGMANAARIPTLQRIEIANANDAMFAGFRNHQGLQSVRIWRSPECTDATAQVLGTCTQLKEVYLDGTKVGDTGLSSIGMLPQLSSVRWSRAPISVSALRYLNPPSVPKIASAAFVDVGLTNEHLVEIGKWPQLSRLNLSRSKVDAAGLAALQRLRLKTLILRDCPLDDAAVGALEPIAGNIATLDLSGTNITQEGSGWILILRGLDHLRIDRTSFSADLLRAAGERHTLSSLEIGGPAVDATWLPKLDGLFPSISGELYLTGPAITDATLVPPGCKVSHLYLKNTSVTLKCLEEVSQWKTLSRVIILHERGTPPPFTYQEAIAVGKKLGKEFRRDESQLDAFRSVPDGLDVTIMEVQDE